jgi:5-methylthioadenosine/S-adenosylhomocysteine deaminase
MNIRFYNARILTMDGNTDIIFGELWVQKNTITYIGDGTDIEQVFPKAEDRKVVWDRQIDANGNLLMPGFKDAHTHSAMTFLRSYADDLPLQSWLNEQVFPREAQLTPDDIYTLTIHGIMEYLTSGITANFDMYMQPQMIARAAVDTGFRTVQVDSINNFGGTIDDVEENYLKYNNFHELSSYVLGFHAEYTTSMELMEGIAALSHKYKAPVYMHNSETKSEVEECYSRYQMSPTQLFDKIGMYDYGGGGYHCVWFDDKDIEIFEKKGLSVVTNPASNAKLASGIAPITKYMEHGINIAIGTDGAASNNCLDMFREMFLTTALAKLKENDAAAVDATDVLYMATVGGAKAMGLTDCDVLAPGKKADLIMIDLEQPNMQPLNNIAKNIVYAGSKQNVKLTMVNGRILYEDGKFDIGVDAGDIYAEANSIIQRMV